MMLIIKVVIILLMLFILFALGSAFYYLVRGEDQSGQIVKALTWRIGLSLALFVLLMFAFAMGWIVPHRIV